MKNITICIPDEAYRNARVWAATRNTSVSAVVREYLARYSEPTRQERRRRGATLDDAEESVPMRARRGAIPPYPPLSL